MKKILSILVCTLFLILSAFSGPWTNYSNAPYPQGGDTFLYSTFSPTSATRQISFDSLAAAIETRVFSQVSIVNPANINNPIYPMNHISDGAATQEQSISTYKAPYNISGISIIFNNWGFGGSVGLSSGVDAPDAAWTNTVYAKFSIEYPIGGKIYPCFYQGQRLVPVVGGATIKFEPTQVFIPVGASYNIRAWNSVAQVGHRWLKGSAVYYDEVGTNLTDKIDGGTMTNTYTFGLFSDFQVAYVTNATILGVGGIGDSICYGQNDGGPLFVPGFLWQVTSNRQIASINCAVPGSRIQSSSPTNTPFRLNVWLQYFSSAVLYVGINDLDNGVTLSVMTNNYNQIIRYFVSQGKTVYPCTIAPHTTSATDWSITNNQTVSAYVNNWKAFNNYIRTLPNYVEVANQVSDTNGYWLPAGGTNGYTFSGLHPNDRGHTQMAQAFTNVVFR